jgi:hypothetical protein
VCVRVCVCVGAHVQAFMRTCVGIHTQVCMRMCVHASVCGRSRAHVSVHARVCVCVGRYKGRFTHTMPFPCHATNMHFMAWSRQGNGMQTAWEWNGIV